MPTKNIVPRAANEGSLGTAAKPWGSLHVKTITSEGGFVNKTGDRMSGPLEIPEPPALTETNVVPNLSYLAKKGLLMRPQNIADGTWGEHDISDFNLAIENGIYRIIPGANTLNQPPSFGGVWGSLVVLGSYGGAITQFVLEASTNSIVANPPMYIRGGSPDANRNYIFTPWRSYHGDEPGTIITSAKMTNVYGYIYCSGQAISRVHYPSLFEAIGTTYGSGDGWSTFNVPDYRGVVLRGLDEGRGLDIERPYGTSIGSYQADQVIYHVHGGGSDQTVGAVGGNKTVSSSTYASTGGYGGNETRMKNIAVSFWIKF